MTDKIASELLVERLISWGVDTVFGLPGDGINGIMEGLRRHKDRIRFVLSHHEEASAFMATGYAKSTGKLGVCLATSGPGGLHLLNGLYDAKLDHVPILAITGMQATTQLGTFYQQEVHLDRVFADLAEYNTMITVPVSIPTLVDIAVRTALSRRTVSHITFPVDIQEADPEQKPYEGGMGVAREPETAPTYRPPRVIPEQGDIDRAASVLNKGENTVVLAGVGALAAADELIATADTLAAPVVKTLPGKAAIPDDHPLSLGGLGLLGTRPAEEAMEKADTLLMVGTNYPYTTYLPEKARVVQIELEPMRIGNRIPVHVPLVGEARETLGLLRPLLQRREERSFLQGLQEDMVGWREDLAALEDADRHPIQPQYLMRVIDRLATDNAILSTDSGTIATWAA
ncbi:MAG TPA: thiamine pyrophosphate-binding protein, partial [Actinomycetota bacterium]|nr:thiamine pyrophosphate-binding protein [Actinomycetota bacterium]